MSPAQISPTSPCTQARILVPSDIARELGMSYTRREGGVEIKNAALISLISYLHPARKVNRPIALCVGCLLPHVFMIITEPVCEYKIKERRYLV